MSGIRAYIVSMGIISPIGQGVEAHLNAIRKKDCGLRLIDLFNTPENKRFPVGQIDQLNAMTNLPRTHCLAHIAAKEALTGFKQPLKLDAIVLGVTTGGIFTTEYHLKQNERNPDAYSYHSLSSVAEHLATEYDCKGPVITISTACSSGTVAIHVGMEMIRQGLAKTVLAGGSDALCRLTYYGFGSLQLIDPDGAKPFDINRNGMSLSEGAAMVLLSADNPEGAIVEVLGGGLSCDAFHPTTPHPDGKGALSAMEKAIHDAGISISDIDYINLHGTGTIDNDLSEAKAITSLFPDKKPFVSSIKGALGHSLGAAGAIEAVISAISIQNNIVPANVGCNNSDPRLQINPICEPYEMPVHYVLSNSFGFGGNNASIVLSKPNHHQFVTSYSKPKKLTILGSACITGIGTTTKTCDQFFNDKSCHGVCSMQDISSHLPQDKIRRLKRLPRMALSLAIEAAKHSGISCDPCAVFLGTGWGALSETYDFLTRLYATHEQFPSPTDFVGSVHNAPASQIAMHFQSKEANITTSGGDYSFEQAILMASLFSHHFTQPFLVVGVDEFHSTLSPLLDSSVINETMYSDGGGAFVLTTDSVKNSCSIELIFYRYDDEQMNAVSALIHKIGGMDTINETYDIIMAGIPKAYRNKGNKQLEKFIRFTKLHVPVIEYRKYFGEFASVSAVAAVMTCELLEKGTIPGEILENKKNVNIVKKNGLLLNFGKIVTAIEIKSP
ncbi:MAG: beta-ketoacyl synthase chain length factor [Desulfobacterales bacterium]|nr:beta-ketoacyl synthase chain length factor [Desulfobacterales bacterium]